MTSPMQPNCIHLVRATMQVVGEETLIYDEIHHQAWCLNNTAACIWRRCDGHSTVNEIAIAAAKELNAPVTDEIVLLTLAELREKNLLEPDTAMLLPDAVSRREMMSRAGLAAAALLPVIASILAPSAHAQSGSIFGMAKRAGTQTND